MIDKIKTLEDFDKWYKTLPQELQDKQRWLWFKVQTVFRVKEIAVKNNNKTISELNTLIKDYCGAIKNPVWGDNK